MIRHNDITIDRAARRITVGEHSHQFVVRCGISVAFEAISHILLNGHTTRRQLLDHVYGRCIEGGPISGENIFDVHMAHWKPMLASLGLQLGRETKSGTQYLFLRVRA